MVIKPGGQVFFLLSANFFLIIKVQECNFFNYRGWKEVKDKEKNVYFVFQSTLYISKKIFTPKTTVMNTSKKWIEHFKSNSLEQRVNWNLVPCISEIEVATILFSLQAWQLGETSDGSHLLRASTMYAKKLGDPDYVNAVTLFIKEEQKHGNNLGKYLDAIGKPRIKSDWGDSLFRKIRYFNTSMEIWTLAVITVESTAQIFYQCLKDATGCTLLKEICSDILIDEAYHIDFQTERLAIIFDAKSFIGKLLVRNFYTFFFFSTALVVWVAHKAAFKAGGVNFKKYMRKMKYKYIKTINRAACLRVKTNGLFQLLSRII